MLPFCRSAEEQLCDRLRPLLLDYVAFGLTKFTFFLLKVIWERPLGEVLV